LLARQNRVIPVRPYQRRPGYDFQAGRGGKKKKRAGTRPQTRSTRSVKHLETRKRISSCERKAVSGRGGGKNADATRRASGTQSTLGGREKPRGGRSRARKVHRNTPASSPPDCRPQPEDFGLVRPGGNLAVHAGTGTGIGQSSPNSSQSSVIFTLAREAGPSSHSSKKRREGLAGRDFQRFLHLAWTGDTTNRGGGGGGGGGGPRQRDPGRCDRQNQGSTRQTGNIRLKASSPMRKVVRCCQGHSHARCCSDGSGK